MYLTERDYDIEWIMNFERNRCRGKEWLEVRADVALSFGANGFPEPVVYIQVPEIIAAAIDALIRQSGGVEQIHYYEGFGFLKMSRNAPDIPSPRPDASAVLIYRWAYSASGE